VPKGLSEIQLVYYLLQVKDDSKSQPKKIFKASAEFHLIFFSHPYPLGYHGKKMEK
jgi:hypothetical protein